MRSKPLRGSSFDGSKPIACGVNWKPICPYVTSSPIANIGTIRSSVACAAGQPARAMSTADSATDSSLVP
jgi:hypothetical protein